MTTASEMGKKGGSSRSDRKVTASRENGKKGGRPKAVVDANDPISLLGALRFYYKKNFKNGASNESFLIWVESQFH